MKFAYLKKPIYVFIILILAVYFSSVLYKNYEYLTNGSGPSQTLYILSNTSKPLSFDTLGQQSFVYVDTQVPTACDEKSDVPQKWQITVLNPDETDQSNMMFTITSSNQNGVKYYLTANADGSVSATLFGGGTNQNWMVIPFMPDPNNVQPNELAQVHIQSRLYGTYLSATNSGYIKDKSGNVFLVGSNQDAQTLWKIMPC